MTIPSTLPDDFTSDILGLVAEHDIPVIEAIERLAWCIAELSGNIPNQARLESTLNKAESLIWQRAGELDRRGYDLDSDTDDSEQDDE